METDIRQRIAGVLRVVARKVIYWRRDTLSRCPAPTPVIKEKRNMPQCTEAPASAPTMLFPLRNADEQSAQKLNERVQQTLEAVNDLRHASRVTPEDLRLHVSM